MSKSMVIGTK